MGIFSGPRERRANRPFGDSAIPPNSSTAQGYQQISLIKAESSLQKIAIWSSINLIASTTSNMPIDVFSGTGVQRRERPVPGWLQDIGGDGYGTADWIYSALVSLLLRGNIYAKPLARDPRTGQPTLLSMYHPDDITSWRDPKNGQMTWYVGGQPIPDDEMWHRRAYTLPGRVLGLSPVAYHAMTIGLGLTAEQFGVQFFADGAHPGGMLTYDGDLSPEAARTAKDRFLAALRGTREPIVMGDGWKWQQIQIAPEESQFLATNAYTEGQCARIYGAGMAEILGYDTTGKSLTYANIESKNLHLLIYALDQWIVRIERWLTSLLPQAQYVKLNRESLLRSTTLDRYAAYQSQLQNGWAVINEVRAKEDMQPVDWGDEPYLLAADPKVPIGEAPPTVPPEGGPDANQG